MENGEHQTITIAESDSNQELPVRSTNEIEESTNVASIIHMQRRLNEIRREGIQNLKERQCFHMQSPSKPHRNQQS
ncbi:hypothetical protein CsSME_00038044 [Camellia sinensis var. sinensis]